MWCRRCTLKRSRISFKRSMRSTPGSSPTKPFSRRCTPLKSEAGWWFQGIFFFGLDFHHSFGKILPRGVCKIFPNAPVAQPVTQEHTLRPSTLMFGMPGVSSNSLTSTKADGRVTAVLQEKARVDTRDSSCCKKLEFL